MAAVLTLLVVLGFFALLPLAALSDRYLGTDFWGLGPVEPEAPAPTDNAGEKDNG